MVSSVNIRFNRRAYKFVVMKREKYHRPSSLYKKKFILCNTKYKKLKTK